MAKIGFIYVIRNEEHVPDRFKVGQTYDVEKRLRELNSETSNVGEFKLIAKFPVEDAEVAERKCHKALEEFKKAKEFFDAPRDKIVARVRYISEKFTPKAYMPEDIEAKQKEVEELQSTQPQTGSTQQQKKSSLTEEQRAARLARLNALAEKSADVTSKDVFSDKPLPLRKLGKVERERIDEILDTDAGVNKVDQIFAELGGRDPIDLSDSEAIKKFKEESEAKTPEEVKASNAETAKKHKEAVLRSKLRR